MALSASALCVAALGFAPHAAAQECPGEESGPSATLDPRIGQQLQELYTQIQEEQYQPALAGLTQLLQSRGDSMKAYDKSTVYELRATVNVNLERFGPALSDFQAALNTGGLPTARNNQLRYFIAQLQVQEEQYDQAISGLNQWIQFAERCGQNVDANAYYLLAASYASKSPPNWQAATNPGEQAIAALAEPKKTYYDLMNLIYSETNAASKRGDLLERMINLWPGEKGYWVQLSGLYSQEGRDREAFSVMEVAYRAGLLESEGELKTLIQYYSFFDNPYRGAIMLQQEMEAGNIDRTQDNLVLLSQLWSQSREHKRSIPILREAAGRSSQGELSYRLGQVLLADEQYAAAQTALQQALNKGGMNARNTGDAWVLLGTARFNQAGPEDTEIWASARQAFVNGQRYQNSRTQSSQWISYIDAVSQTYRDQRRLEAQQRRERCEENLARLEREKRIRELQNRQPTEEERREEAEILAECGPGASGGSRSQGAQASAQGEASEGAGEDAAEGDDGAATEEEEPATGGDDEG